MPAGQAKQNLNQNKVWIRHCNYLVLVEEKSTK